MVRPVDNPGFALVSRTTMAGAAFEQIKELISKGTLSPGERLPSERELSTHLGVSRGSVREAISALVSIGILESRPGLGTYVTSLSSDLLAAPLTFIFDANPGAIVDLFDLRLMIEVGAAEDAARQIQDDTVVELQGLIERMETEINDIEAFFSADVEFHRCIHEATGNELLVSVMDSLATLGREHRISILEDYSLRQATLREHQEIVKALAQRDTAAASTAMKEHLTHIRSMFGK